MSIFENLNKQNNQKQQADMNTLFQQFCGNPLEFLIKSKLNIPQNVSDPRQIVQYLANTNQIPQQLQQRVNQMLGR